MISAVRVEKIEAVVYSKSLGIFCGKLVVNGFINFFDNIDVTWMVENGDVINKGDVVVKIYGEAG